MLLQAKLTAPRPDYAALDLPALHRVFENPFTLFIAPEGYLLTDSLASTLQERQPMICWLRLGLEDCDPGTLLLSLITGLQRFSPGAGEATLNLMRGQPGPIAGWESHFALLANEYSEALARNALLVLENIECLIFSPGPLKYLGSTFLPRLRADIRCILISQQRLPRASLPDRTNIVESGDLRLDDQSGDAMLRRSNVELSMEGFRRAARLTGGQPGVLAGLSQAAEMLGEAWVDQEVRRAGNLDDLLSRITRACLEGVGENSLQALALAIHLDYSHPSILSAAQPPGPWLQPLMDGWDYMRGLWNRPLHKVLRTRAVPHAGPVRQAANVLSEQSALFQAVDLFFQSRDTASAARAINNSADIMMDLGQWATLNAWLRRLSPQELDQWPWLMYISGKISAAQGHVEPARRAFSSSSEMFTRRKDPSGACLSLLAESALAAWRGEITLAKERALSAYALTQREELHLYQCWSAWQLGSLAAQAGDLDEALQWFSPAAALAEQTGQGPMAEMLRLVEKLIQNHQDFQRQREVHQRAYLDALNTEKQLSAKLKNLLNSPPENLGELLQMHGWTHIPVMPISSAFVQSMPGEKTNSFPINLFSFLLDALKLRPGETNPITSENDAVNEWRLDPQESAQHTGPDSPSWGRESQAQLPFPTNPVHVDQTNRPNPARPTGEIRKSQRPRKGRPSGTNRQSAASQPALLPTIRVHLFGSFQVLMDNQALDEWTNNRGKAIFKYLLMHHDQFVAREVLMETFWPDANPESARNRLNVALHSLRTALHSTKTRPVILFNNGAYRLNPERNIWLDVNEFRTHILNGHQHEAADHPKAAQNEYESAVELYVGDFLADDPYEEWPIHLREQLRVTYLDTLDRLCQIYLTGGDYNACISLCQIILSNDNCREDAHCRLMRCYNRLGQDHMALRQYQVCCDALKLELDVAPAPTTTQLYEKIRRHESI